MNKLLTILLILCSVLVHAQDQGKIMIEFPSQDKWNEIEEGELLEFQLSASGGLSENYRFSATADTTINFELTPEGRFSWLPSYDLVNSREESKTFPILFEVTNQGGQSARRQVEFVVFHQDRLPSLQDLDPFVVKPEEQNVYDLGIDTATFEIRANDLPQGMLLQEEGQFVWTPTETQWLKLGENPVEVYFSVIDTSYGDEAVGKLQIIAAERPEEETEETASGSDLKLVLPDKRGWNVAREGEALSFQLAARGGSDNNYTYNMLLGSDEDLGISFDRLGNFYWNPPFDLVDRLEEEQLVELIFEVTNASGESDRQQVDLLVYHTNRPPVVGDLKTFYVSYNTKNTYELEVGQVITDPDNDPLVFKPVLSQMPQGLNISGNGEITWKPSYNQYRRLQEEPMKLAFIVEDQPYKAQTKGFVRIAVTQQDHPPEISMVPANQSEFSIREDETLNLKFYLSDPNGDQDIVAFDFVSESSRIPRSALVKNDQTQWEFKWTPGYDFFVEPNSKETYKITFYVVDKSNQRAERSVSVTIEDAENLEEKDMLLYSQYRTGLVRVMNLIDQLKEKQKELKKDYRKAKRTKKHRAITTASLGAITGLSPVVITTDQEAQRYVSGIGGTTSMTLGSLEASNVIGKDPSSVFENLSYINQKLNDLETQGNVFAGKYALPGSRRSETFNEDLKKLIVLLSMKEVTTLELDAGWDNSRKATDKNIKDTFKDFNPDPEKSSIIND